MNNEPTKALNGAWTPWAAVLCVECEYAALKDRAYPTRLKAVSAMERTATIAQPNGCQLAQCDECRCSCWARADVALLQQVGFRSSDLDWEGPFGWALQQTGGMCAALVFSTEGREIVVTAMDGEFFVGEYPEGGPWDEPLRKWQSASLYEGEEMKGGPALGAMAEECARKAIEFIRQPGTAA